MENQPFKSLIQRLSKLEKIHGFYQQAEAEVEAHIGMPICVPNCGLCCQNNSPMVWGIEVEAIASYLIGQGDLLNTVMDRCEHWLRTSNGKVHPPAYYQQNTDKLMERAHELYTGCCVLLGTDKRCLIHPARPLTCRAYGVTSYPTDCPRPYGLGESASSRAYNNGIAPVVKEALNQLLKECASDSFAASVGFLPTLLMRLLRSRQFVSLVDSGKVDPVKLVRNFIHSPAIITQDQLADFSLAGDEALQEVELTGINTGPITVAVN